MQIVEYNDLSVWPSVDMSASINGPWIRVKNAPHFSSQLTWTGAALNGTLSMQVANGPADTTMLSPASTPVALSGASFAMVNSLVGAESSLILSFENVVAFSWIRWVWTRTSGTGTLTDSQFVLKGF